MNQQICEAIRERRILRFQYDGGIRRVEPHCHGRSREGNELLRGYQLGGHSASGEATGWKTYRVERIADLLATGFSFPGPRPEYDPADNRMAMVHCCLE